VDLADAESLVPSNCEDPDARERLTQCPKGPDADSGALSRRVNRVRSPCAQSPQVLGNLSAVARTPRGKQSRCNDSHNVIQKTDPISSHRRGGRPVLMETAPPTADSQAVHCSCAGARPFTPSLLRRNPTLRTGFKARKQQFPGSQDNPAHQVHKFNWVRGASDLA